MCVGVIVASTAVFAPSCVAPVGSVGQKNTLQIVFSPLNTLQSEAYLHVSSVWIRGTVAKTANRCTQREMRENGDARSDRTIDDKEGICPLNTPLTAE